MNLENLTPFGSDKMTPERHREISAMGGRARAASIRRRKNLKEAADLFLSMPVADQKMYKKIAGKGLTPEDIDNQMAIIVALSLLAAKGDVRAAKLIFDLVGVDVKQADREVTIVDDIPAD